MAKEEGIPKSVKIIALIVVLGVLFTALGFVLRDVIFNTAEPAPQPAPQPSPEPAPVPTPEPTPQPTPQPTPEPTPQPTPEPTEPALTADSYYVVVSKESQKMYLYDKEDSLVKEYVISTGLFDGDKEVRGDCRTPEGTFTIKLLEEHYIYEQTKFGQGFYGPLVMVLDTSQKQAQALKNFDYYYELPCLNNIRHVDKGEGAAWETLGLQGTSRPENLGQNYSYGEIRLSNTDILELKEYLMVGSKVIIEPKD